MSEERWGGSAPGSMGRHGSAQGVSEEPRKSIYGTWNPGDRRCCGSVLWMNGVL